MTVSSDQTSVDHIGNGATTVFAVPYYFLQTTDIKVRLITPSGVVTELVLFTDYTVLGAGNPAGGSVTIAVAPANLVTVTIYRDVPATQLTNYQPNDDFPAKSHERALDKLTMLVQQLIAGVGNSLQLLANKSGWDFLGYRGVNAGDPINAQDVTTRSWVENIVSGVAGGYGFFIQNGIGAVIRTFQDKMRDTISPKDFGAIGDGIADDTANFASIQSSNNIVDGLGKTYRVGALNFTGAIKLKNIEFMPINSFVGTTLITFSGNDASLDISVDADNKGFTCVDVTGNRIKGVVRTSNILGVTQAAGGTQSGCRIIGQYCKIDVYGDSILRGASDNDSIPRIATADLGGGGTGNNNIVRVYGNNVNAGFVVSQPQAYCPEILIDGLTDNGVYHLGGRLDSGSITLKNSLDEGIVTEGTMSIGRFHLVNPMGSSGVQTGNLTIGDYFIESNDPSRSYVPLRARSGNVQSNVKIGTLRGEIYLTDAANGAGILQLAAGETTELTVDTIDLKVHYRAGSTKVLMNDDNGKKVSFGSIAIELIDDTATLTNADKFDFRIAPNITRQSYIGQVTNVSSSGDIRIANAIQSLIQLAPDMEISTTSGPYISQENAANPNPGRSVGTGVPTVGAWLRGWVIAIKAPFIGGVSEYTNTTGGSQGVWRASKWIVGRGVTGSRPTLTANDTGVMYMDNTLDSDGKPIWWNGTAWVDATGAVV